jgi:hypothetical protein
MIGRRNHYTNSQKIQIFKSIEAATAPGENQMSIRAACQVHNIHPRNYRQWKKNIVSIMSASRDKRKPCIPDVDHPSVKKLKKV